MSKYTPGPWWIKFEVNVFGSNGRLVANCGGTQDSMRVFEAGAENASNARLIVAAPELLEALEMVRDADNDNGRKIPSLARAKIDAAIAKARGEQ